MKKTIFTLGLAFFLIIAFTASVSAWWQVGCTPGYWKQPQHFGDWVEEYIPEGEGASKVMDVFDCSTPPPSPIGSMSLLTALKTGGGGVYALTRHAIASLLYAALPGPFDGGSPAAVISAYCEAIGSTDPGAIEAQKDVFEGYNEQECNLGGSGRANGRE